MGEEILNTGFGEAFGTNIDVSAGLVSCAVCRDVGSGSDEPVRGSGCVPPDMIALCDVSAATFIT